MCRTGVRSQILAIPSFFSNVTNLSQIGESGVEAIGKHVATILWGQQFTFWHEFCEDECNDDTENSKQRKDKCCNTEVGSGTDEGITTN